MVTQNTEPNALNDENGQKVLVEQMSNSTFETFSQIKMETFLDKLLLES